MYLGLLDSMKTFSWISGGAGVLSSSPCLATASERTERGSISLYSVSSALIQRVRGPANEIESLKGYFTDSEPEFYNYKIAIVL